MRFATRALLSAATFIFFVTTSSYAQGGATSAITGVVTDSDGGVIPGANVLVTSNATGSKFEAVTNATGAYSVPALSAGVYTVTVSLAGFKTAVINEVRVQLGVPTTLNAKLELGTLEETITVSGASAELINTLTPAVTATMNVDQIALIPTPTRNALNAVTFLVGINTPGGMRGSTINGLPESYINLTLDGVSNNDTFNKRGNAETERRERPKAHARPQTRADRTGKNRPGSCPTSTLPVLTTTSVQDSRRGPPEEVGPRPWRAEPAMA
jgi:hypothetical protein